MRLGEPGLIERQVAEAGFRGARSARHTLDWLVADPEEGWRQQVLDGPPATRVGPRADCPTDRS